MDKLAELSFKLAKWIYKLAELSFKLSKWIYKLAELSFKLAKWIYKLAELSVLESFIGRAQLQLGGSPCQGGLSTIQYPQMQESIPTSTRKYPQLSKSSTR